jgi:hypothetical protein
MIDLPAGAGAATQTIRRAGVQALELGASGGAALGRGVGVEGCGEGGEGEEDRYCCNNAGG